MMERFFLNLKMERVWQRDYANHAEAMTDIADYIVGFYNSMRLHSPGQLATECLQAAIGNQTTYHGVRKNLTNTDQRLRRWFLVITSIVSVFLVAFTVLLISSKISDGPCPVIQGASSGGTSISLQKVLHSPFAFSCLETRAKVFSCNNGTLNVPILAIQALKPCDSCELAQNARLILPGFYRLPGTSVAAKTPIELRGHVLPKTVEVFCNCRSVNSFDNGLCLRGYGFRPR